MTREQFSIHIEKQICLGRLGFHNTMKIKDIIIMNGLFVNGIDYLDSYWFGKNIWEQE